MATSQWTSTLHDLTPKAEVFLGDVLTGLTQRPKQLPCKYFYDDRGSRLFEEICGLQEYYLTRTEIAIMRRHASEMAEQAGPKAMVVDYGSGSGMKTRILLDHLREPVAYVPVDISREHLLWTAQRIASAYPDLEVLPVCADFAGDFHLPLPASRPARTMIYFPGSTIGNFDPEGAHDILAKMAGVCGAGDGLLIGIDLRKDAAVLEAAYNDRKGVTAEFNRNLLRRVNRELGGDFDLAGFEHRAVYNRGAGRVEMYLVSRYEQVVTVGSESFHLATGEPISTEYSYKYTIPGFTLMASEAGWTQRKAWTDDRNWFAVLSLSVAD